MPLAPWLEHLLLRATSAFIDVGEGACPDPESAGCPARLRGMVDHLPKDQVRLLHLGGRVVDLIAVLRFGRRFRSLDDGRARRLLAGLADSRLRSVRRLHFVLKMTTQYAYFTGEATWKVTGFDGPWQPGPDVPVQPPPQLPSETGA